MKDNAAERDKIIAEVLQHNKDFMQSMTPELALAMHTSLISEECEVEVRKVITKYAAELDAVKAKYKLEGVTA